MNIVKIKRINKLDKIDVSDPNWKSDCCYYILTFLSSLPNGVIFAEWIPDVETITWEYSHEPGLLLRPPKAEEKLLIHDNVHCYRPVLAALGNITVDDCFVGAGTFRIHFHDEPENDRLYGIFFSNTQELGYWIRLHILRNVSDSF